MDIGKPLHEIYLEFSHFFKKVYPDFVTSAKPHKLQGIPVFTFHTVKPEIFKEQLEFLKENNYETIRADELHSYLTGRSTMPEKSVLLTFDDGRKSVWTYGLPLLKEYGFRATVFVIPGHTKDKDIFPTPQSSPQRGEDVLNEVPLPQGERVGEGGLEVIGEKTGNDAEEILSWKEIRIMNDSGIIDFGSHTLYHNKIFTGSEIIDFLSPGQKILPYEYPGVPAGHETSLFEGNPYSFFGMPIYINDSPMAGKPRFMDDSGLRDECMKYFGERTGNPSILNLVNNPPSPPFSKGGMGGLWKKEMFSFASDYRKRNHVPDRFSTPEETAKEIYDNLSISKKILEEKLGKPVNHLCYPFGVWSVLSMEMASKAGYLLSFCAYIPGRPINKSGDDPHKIVRLKDDYIFRLPGKGRKSLIEIFSLKMKRRLKGEMVY